jgi:allophanate hydrolase subunit 1
MDIVYSLEAPVSQNEAEALTQWLQEIPGILSVSVDPAQKRLYLKFEPRRITTMALDEKLKRKGIKVSNLEQEPSESTELPGYTNELEGERQELEEEIRVQRDAELD